MKVNLHDGNNTVECLSKGEAVAKLALYDANAPLYSLNQFKEKEEMGKTVGEFCEDGSVVSWKKQPYGHNRIFVTGVSTHEDDVVLECYCEEVFIS